MLFWSQPGQSGTLCSTLLAARREAERRGVLDFSAKAQPYRTGRIEFTGNHHYADSTLRRNFVLDEGEWLDQRLLRKSIARLNQTGLFERIQERDIAILRHPETSLADVTIRLKERKGRAWAISGPLGPMSFAGPLQASLSSRLPAWATYAASVSLFVYGRPLLVFALARPYSPGEGWKSGFAIAPQLGWQRSALSYAMTQAQHRLLDLLDGNRGLERPLAVTVERPSGDAIMYCEPPKPGLLRSVAAIAVRFM